MLVLRQYEHSVPRPIKKTVVLGVFYVVRVVLNTKLFSEKKIFQNSFQELPAACGVISDSKSVPMLN
jgi:hypothetical protein